MITVTRTVSYYQANCRNQSFSLKFQSLSIELTSIRSPEKLAPDLTLVV